jgi:hypothetical protein
VANDVPKVGVRQTKSDPKGAAKAEPLGDSSYLTTHSGPSSHPPVDGKRQKAWSLERALSIIRNSIPHQLPFLSTTSTPSTPLSGNCQLPRPRKSHPLHPLPHQNTSLKHPAINSHHGELRSEKHHLLKQSLTISSRPPIASTSPMLPT